MTKEDILNMADLYARVHTGCLKVSVGCAIVREYNDDDRRIYRKRVIALGANKSLPDCRSLGQCNRVKLYGEDSKKHRLPSDCNAIHSEIDAICNATEDLTGCTAYITRYPCEACARALVNAGITKVVYGRKQEISDITKNILKNVDVIWVKDWDREDRYE